MAFVLAAGMTSLLRNSRLAGWALRHMPFGAVMQEVLDTVYGYRRHYKYLLAAVGISLAAHTLTIGVTLTVAAAINPAGFNLSMSLLIPLGFLANALPLTPGGLGVGEAAFNRLFSAAGFSGGAEALLGWRLLTFAVGLVGLVFYVQGRQRYVQSAVAEAAGASTQ
jgi:uncharacterized membrane protein YbhN (UPF0104 family)